MVWDRTGGEKRSREDYSLGSRMGGLSLSFHKPRSMRILDSHLASLVVMKINVKVEDKNHISFNSLTF